MRVVMAAALLAALAGPVRAAGPSQEQITDAVGLGGVAALATVCGLRDEAWAADLRRSTIQGATGTAAFDDRGLRAAPGSDLVIGALSYAETEALEDFAEAPAARTCGPLASRLGRADAMVGRFRAGMPAS